MSEKTKKVRLSFGHFPTGLCLHGSWQFKKFHFNMIERKLLIIELAVFTHRVFSIEQSRIHFPTYVEQTCNAKSAERLHPVRILKKSCL